MQQKSIQVLGSAALFLLAGCGDDGSANDGGPETGAEMSVESDTESDDEPESESDIETETDTDIETETDTNDELDTETETDTDDENEDDENESDTDDPPDLEGVCGNGLVHVDEACDDGNDVAGDGCESDCTLSVTVEWMVVDPALGYPCSEHQVAVLSPDGDLFTVGAAVAGQGITRVDSWDRDTGESLASFSANAGTAYPTFNEPVDASVAADGGLFVTNAGGILGFGLDGQFWRFSSDLGLEWMVDDAALGETIWGFAGVVAVDDGAVVLHGNGRLTRVGPNGNPIDTVEVPESIGTYGAWPADLAPAGDGQVALLHALWEEQLDKHFAYVWHYDVETLDLAFAPWQWEAGEVENTRLKELAHHDGATWVLGDLPADDDDLTHWWPTLWYLGVDQNYPSAVRSFGEFGYVNQDARRGFAIRDDGVKVLALQHTLIGLDADGKLLWHIEASDVDPNAAASATPSASNFADAVIDIDGTDGAMFVGSASLPAYACDRVAWAGRVSW